MVTTDLAVLKSSVDKWGKDLAVAAAIPGGISLDIDDRLKVAQLLTQKSSAGVVWRILDFSNSHRRGIFNFAVAFGSAVQTDDNNMLAMSVAGLVPEKFCIGRTYDVLNYTQTPVVHAGRFSVVNVDTSPQLTDTLTAYRLVAVEGFVTFDL